ncbi:hypothetical protein OVA12_04430 [Pannonibacter sp. SL95]|nr:hypothetical protein [Pannonibacter sp. SL95]MCY1705274.1 hypothetical protein [Pannonibacter sp. SL95]
MQNDTVERQLSKNDGHVAFIAGQAVQMIDDQEAWSLVLKFSQQGIQTTTIKHGGTRQSVVSVPTLNRSANGGRIAHARGLLICNGFVCRIFMGIAPIKKCTFRQIAPHQLLTSTR